MRPSLRGQESVLGRVRFRFRMHWPLYAWAIVWLLPALVSGLAVLAGDPTAALVLWLLLSVLVSVPLTWVFRRFQIVMTDRAIVLGLFFPGAAPTVIFYPDIDLPTVRAWSNLRAYLRSARQPSVSSGYMITEGARGGITFLALRSGAMRGGKLQEDTMVTRLGGSLELFALSGSTGRFVTALSTCMAEAGIPAARRLPETALPPGRLSGARDSHRQEIPGWPAPSQERFEDLPPELQERIRRHTIG